MVKVNVDNFRAAETALMFDNQLALSGGINPLVSLSGTYGCRQPAGDTHESGHSLQRRGG